MSQLKLRIVAAGHDPAFHARGAGAIAVERNYKPPAVKPSGDVSQRCSVAVFARLSYLYLVPPEALPHSILYDSRGMQLRRRARSCIRGMTAAESFIHWDDEASDWN